MVKGSDSSEGDGFFCLHFHHLLFLVNIHEGPLRYDRKERVN